MDIFVKVPANERLPPMEDSAHALKRGWGTPVHYSIEVMVGRQVSDGQILLRETYYDFKAGKWNESGVIYWLEETTLDELISRELLEQSKVEP